MSLIPNRRFGHVMTVGLARCTKKMYRDPSTRRHRFGGRVPWLKKPSMKLQLINESENFFLTLVS